MAVCLSQLYQEQKRGIKAGYAKFETFPVWDLPLKHPVHMAYEAATADLNDVNMIDPFHLDAYGRTAVNYNRDIEIFPVLNTLFEGIYGECPYKSPTDMGVNMAGNCIIDNDAVCEASKQEIVRKWYRILGFPSVYDHGRGSVKIPHHFKHSFAVLRAHRANVHLPHPFSENINKYQKRGLTAP